MLKALIKNFYIPENAAPTTIKCWQKFIDDLANEIEPVNELEYE